MYLKKIELNGFKSFANKTDFHINPGITAIVGPNGSGKSNVIDGIKWVLGEQSAKSLRGSKMEDIIFAGSEGRKQKNYAEVSLCFDNSDGKLGVDYSEVNIMRRIFRDGESEYYINKASCRLKDIHELFMDTGIGKEAYSIISQGQVEDILSSRPEEKRVIFEEAAGIVKYKNKKKESLKKLDETEQNLVRVDDILFQLEQDLPKVKDEALKAENYKTIKDKLKSLEVAVVLEKINNLDSQYIETDKQIQEKKQLQSEVDNAMQVTSQTKQELQTRQKEIEIERSSLRDRELDIIKELGELKYTLQLTSQQIAEGKRKIEALNFENVELDDLLKQANKTSEKLEQKIKENQLLLDESKDSLKVEEQQSKLLLKDIEKDKETLEKLKEQVIDILNSVATIKNELKNLESNKARIVSEQGRKERELSHLKNRDILTRKTALEITNEVEKQKTRLQEIEQKKLNLDEEIELKVSEITKVKSTIEQKTNISNEVKSKIKALTNLEESFAGYTQGPKEALKKYNQHPAMDGSVAQIIEVPEHLTVAVEVALGSSLQNLVVRDDNFASEAIEYLRVNKLGRATFLPLNIIKGTALSINDSEIIGVASRLVNFNSKYQGIIDFLLGRILIVDSLKVGLKIAKKYGYKYRVVSLDGDVLNAGGSMTGGKYNTKQSGILQRSQEIELLKKENSGYEESLLNLKEEITKKDSELNTLNHKLEKANSLLKEIAEKNNNLTQQSLLINKEVDTIKEHISLINHEKQLFDNEFLQLEKKISEALTLEESKALEKQKITARISEVNERILNLNDEYESLKAKTVSKQITIASLEQELQSIKKQLVMMSEEEKRNSNRLKNNINTVNSTQEDIENLQVQLKELNDKQMHLEDVKLSITNQQSLNNSSKREVDEKLESILEKVKELEDSRELLNSKVNSLNLKKSKIIIELDGLTEKLLSEYFLTVGEAKSLNLPSVNEKDALREINILREDLKGLGEVNLGAIEEYKKVSGKIAFLEEQKADLKRAKLDLRKIILEMDRQMASQFEQSFEKIKEYFAEVFQKLFNGGRGYLRLTDPDNILESGVEIFVQPPGKKLQSMTLLSGGEKALTAIALLFAILKTRPSPFCVLDEIEASLDEANVDRFGAFLKEMSKESQFIVVTHRKGTMESADILYGITMQENGISKQISVNLDKKVG